MLAPHTILDRKACPLPTDHSAMSALPSPVILHLPVEFRPISNGGVVKSLRQSLLNTKHKGKCSVLQGGRNWEMSPRLPRQRLLRKEKRAHSNLRYLRSPHLRPPKHHHQRQTSTNHSRPNPTSPSNASTQRSKTSSPNFPPPWPSPAFPLPKMTHPSPNPTLRPRRPHRPPDLQSNPPIAQPPNLTIPASSPAPPSAPSAKNPVALP